MTTTDRELRQALALLRAALEGLDTTEPRVLGAAAALFAACAKVADAGTFVCAAKLGDGGARRLGATSAAALAARWAGTSTTKARRAMGAVDGLAALPAARAALVAGELSVDQAALIAPVLALAPTRAPALLEAARREPLSGLRDETARMHAALASEQALEHAERLRHSRRYCRVFQVEGGIRIDALLAGHDAAIVQGALWAATRRMRQEAAATGVDATFDQLRADALVSLARGDPRGTGSAPHVLVHVDAAALRRGAIQGDERCEIAGVGPVSVACARALLGEGFFSILVRDGADITTVTSMNRTIPRRLRTALVARDPHCVVPGCRATDNLELDHWRRDFANFGPTELDNLCRLCSRHHKMKTRTGWRLVGGPGKWRWLAPHALGEREARAPVARSSNTTTRAAARSDRQGLPAPPCDPERLATSGRRSEPPGPAPRRPRQGPNGARAGL